MKKSIITALAALFAICTYAQVGVGTVTPNSTLDVRGSISTNYRAFTAATTATATDNLLVFTGTTATTITLPTAIGCDGRSYMIKNASTTGPTPVLTIATTSAQTIDAAGSWTLTSVNETITLISNGTNWMVAAQSLPGGSGVNWSQNGNSVASLKSIGTISNFALPFITNNTEKMRLTTAGSLGLGTSAFNGTYPEKLLVDAGTTTSVNAIVGKGTIDSYLQLNIQNNSAGTSASSDVVATANNGSETTNYVDMGINGGSYSGGVMGAANDSYLYNQGQNFLIGTGTASKSLVFMTGGTTQATNERMRIDGNGNVGIGTTNPAYKLQVNAASNPLYLGGVQTGAGTDSVLTITNGIVKKLHPTALSNWGMSGNSGINPATNFLGTTDDKQMIIKSNNQSFLEFGRRQTLGLTQGYTDYDDNDEKVTYVRSALQFEAPNASFYKPKMFTDANGNFRVKGSSAGTDYFEFGSTGSNNNGGFEFIIGDDGDEPILFKSYNYLTGMSEIMRLQSGRMAVGSNAFNATNPEKLLIDAGVTSSYNLMTGKGSIDNYLQINVQNRSNGTSASSDLVATADNGTETANYIDMGVNSSAYNNTAIPVLNGINKTYLYGAGNDLAIGNLGNNKPIVFFTTPNATQANAAERMRIDGAGNVGIGTTTPSTALHVAGTNPLTLMGVQAGTNTAADSVLTITGGLVKKLPASTFVASSGNNLWAQGGNTVTTAKAFGTIDNNYLPIITNNTERMRIDASGNTGIGTSTFNATNPEKLIVDAGTTTSVNAIVGKGSIDSYLQLNIQNNSTGTSASSDVVATANNGTETSNYIDMGINGGNYTGGIMGAANDGYLYTMGNNFLLGTANASKSLVFMTGGTSQSANERMRIDGTGKVGIGTTAPASPLHVSASNGNLLYLHTLTGGSANIQFKTYTGTANPTAQIGAVDDGSYSSHIAFSTKIPGADANALSERVRISAAGNVGIGTTTPSQKMDVNGTIVSSATTYPNYAYNTANRMAFGESNVPTNETGSVVQYGSGSNTRNMLFAFSKTGVNTSFLGNDGTQMMLGTESTAPITFRTGLNYTAANIIASGTEAMRLTSAGQLGIGTTAPTSTLHVAGSVTMALTTKTATYTVTASDYTILCNNTSGAITINLPAASGCSGRMYVIKKISAVFNNVTIDGNASETIDGSTTRVLTSQYESVRIQSDGSNWFVL